MVRKLNKKQKRRSIVSLLLLLLLKSRLAIATAFLMGTVLVGLAFVPTSFYLRLPIFPSLLRTMGFNIDGKDPRISSANLMQMLKLNEEFRKAGAPVDVRDILNPYNLGGSSIDLVTGGRDLAAMRAADYADLEKANPTGSDLPLVDHSVVDPLDQKAIDAALASMGYDPEDVRSKYTDREIEELYARHVEDYGPVSDYRDPRDYDDPGKPIDPGHPGFYKRAPDELGLGFIPNPAEVDGENKYKMSQMRGVNSLRGLSNDRARNRQEGLKRYAAIHAKKLAMRNLSEVLFSTMVGATTYNMEASSAYTGAAYDGSRVGGQIIEDGALAGIKGFDPGGKITNDALNNYNFDPDFLNELMEDADRCLAATDILGTVKDSVIKTAVQSMKKPPKCCKNVSSHNNKMDRATDACNDHNNKIDYVAQECKSSAYTNSQIAKMDCSVYKKAKVKKCKKWKCWLAVFGAIIGFALGGIIGALIGAALGTLLSGVAVGGLIGLLMSVATGGLSTALGLGDLGLGGGGGGGGDTDWSMLETMFDDDEFEDEDDYGDYDDVDSITDGYGTNGDGTSGSGNSGSNSSDPGTNNSNEVYKGSSSTGDNTIAGQLGYSKGSDGYYYNASGQAFDAMGTPVNK